MYIKEKRNVFSFSCVCSYGSAFTVTQTLEEIVFFFRELRTSFFFFFNSIQDSVDFNQVIISSLFVIAINLQKMYTKPTAFKQIKLKTLKLGQVL